MRDICLQFYYLVKSLSGFSIRVMVAPEKLRECFILFHFLWGNLYRIDIFSFSIWKNSPVKLGVQFSLLQCFFSMNSFSLMDNHLHYFFLKAFLQFVSLKESVKFINMVKFIGIKLFIIFPYLKDLYWCSFLVLFFFSLITLFYWSFQRQAFIFIDFIVFLIPIYF